jgi:hypothetical protein
LLAVLLETAERLGVKVRVEDLQRDETPTASGACKVRGEWVVILDKRSGPEEKIAVLADALRTMDLDGIYLPPAARDLLDGAPDGENGDEET